MMNATARMLVVVVAAAVLGSLGLRW